MEKVCIECKHCRDLKIPGLKESLACKFFTEMIRKEYGTVIGMYGVTGLYPHNCSAFEPAPDEPPYVLEYSQDY